MQVSKIKTILIGGFLGAGKTTMMRAAAEMLAGMKHRVGLITNDQTTNLVDTYMLAGCGVVHEVSGSCFCCNFPGFEAGIAHVMGEGADIILAEPVGSCTDLSATIVQPIKDRRRDDIDLAPLTVMVDPTPLKRILDGDTATSTYIMTKQLDEADVILINKTDLLTDAQIKDLEGRAAARWGSSRVLCASVKTGRGVAEWLDAVMQGGPSGTHLADVDYDIYADGEAAYGWLNAVYTFDTDAPHDDLARRADDLLHRLARAFDDMRAGVGHVKFLYQSKDHQWMGNITGSADTASLRGEAASSPVSTITVNARVELGPKALQDVVLKALDEVYGTFECTGTKLHCLIPGRPNPTYRYSQTV